VLGQKSGTFDCLQLLQAMELNVTDDEDMEDQMEPEDAHVAQDDEETIQLPEEWVFELQNKIQSPKLMDEASRNSDKSGG
jgi:hypothetical protein